MVGGLLILAQLSISVSAPDSVAACAPLAVTVQIRAPGTQAPALVLPDLRPFSLVESSARPRLETDARRAMWVTDEYRYVLSTPRPGVYVIPPFAARLAGESARSEPLRVTVIPAELSGGPEIVTRARIDHGRPVHFRAMVLPDTVYVGQQVTFQAAAFLEDSVQARLRRNPEFFPPEMRAMLAYDLPFVRGYLPRRGGTRCYEVPVFQRAIFPLMPGRHVIPPAQLVYTLPRSHSFFSREENHELRTDSVTVVAIEPPREGRPADFTGAVGAFSFAVRLDTSEARVGVPIVLTARVSGTGNIKLLPRPGVHLPWGSVVASNERVEVAGNGRIAGAKEFDWVVTPHRAGPLIVPPFRYTYFDPDRERYAVAESMPIELSVAPGSIAAIDTGAAVARPMTIRREYRGPVSRPLHSHPAFWLVLFAAPLPAFALGALRRPKRAPVPRTPAQRLRDLSRGSGRADPRRVRRAFVSALSSRLALPALTMTRRGALIRALRRGGVSSEVASEAEALLIALDSAAFGRGAARPSDAAARAWRLYMAVDREAMRRPRTGRTSQGDAASGVRSMLLLLVAFLGGVTTLEARRAPEPAERHFAQGIARYEAGQYHAAALSFGTAARLEPRAADAWANFGTAAWAVADTVDALVGWHRALRLEPVAGDVRERLSLVNAGLPGELDAVPAVPAWPLATAAAALWLLACAMGFAYARTGAATSVGLARVAGVAALSLGVIAWHVDRRLAGDDLVIATGPTPLRVVPALGAEFSTSVAGADIMRRVESRGAWVRVRTADAREGWLESTRLVPLARD